MGGGSSTTNTHTSNTENKVVNNHNINNYDEHNNYGENTSKQQYFRGNQFLGGLDEINGNINMGMEVHDLRNPNMGLMNLNTGLIRPVRLVNLI